MTTAFDQYLAEKLQKPGFRAAYEAEQRRLNCTQATSLDELLRAVKRTEDDDWSDGESRGLVASDLPTFGPRTAEVRSRINASGPDGEILSWDTRDEGVERYLMRGSDCGRRTYEIIEAAE